MNQLAAIIRREIQERGPMTFARFMELALYHPELGYYERHAVQIGRGGDFYTSVSVGSFFGELLARQFARWLEELAGDNLQIVEIAAHDGKLAGDILRALEEVRPQWSERIHYRIIEPSEKRRSVQQAALAAHGGKVHWSESWSDETLREVRGVIFSNEFYDALPAHRFGWDRGRREWFEWRVASTDDGFCWTRARASSTHISELLAPLGAEEERSALLGALPDGYTMELCPAAAQAWREAATHLRGGRLLAIDYGAAASALWTPRHAAGTARAYCRHAVSGDLLAHPGEQDLTAHVNFSALENAGIETGLKTEGFATQAQFLHGIARQEIDEDASFAELLRLKSREFQTLTHPEFLGRSFRTLIQRR